MSQPPSLEDEAAKKNFAKPYGSKHPIPTIQGYRQHRKDIEKQYGSAGEAQDDQQEDGRHRRAYDSAKAILKGEDKSDSQDNPYPSANHNDQNRLKKNDFGQDVAREDEQDEKQQQGKDDSKKDTKGGQSATEQAAGAIDPKEKRKAMKGTQRGGQRQVTDPVTHLPIVIHDLTDRALKGAPENDPVPGSEHRTATGLSGASKNPEELDEERDEIQRGHNALQKTFPPPDFKDIGKELASIYKLAITFGLSSLLALALVTVGITWFLRTSESIRTQYISFSLLLTVALAIGGAVVFAVRGWVDKKVDSLWEDETWDAARQEEYDHVKDDSELPESVHWLNSLLTSIWPLINPDLFSSLVDMLEDVMQASLPKVVRMVSVDDMGQGSESLRILGIKWLPTGAAAQSVDDSGNLKTPKENQTSDRTDPGEGQQDQSADATDDQDDAQDDNSKSEQKKQEESEQQAMRAGMEAEEGDFVNMELAFSYRARSSGKSIMSKAKNAHLYLKFYLPGGIVVPVWVELRGIVGIMRLRLQLTPDPPFFSICTFTFLGQPKADLSCVPLSRHSLNLMDVPLISSFVQSAIDAALAEYVAPKSMTLDLKDMLMGEDFKKDTATRGVVWIFIKQARGFKQGDGGIGPKEGSSDSYVTVSWGKFGKPVASTRIVEGDQEPNWHEWASILVSADELNANERLRLQLWDSDKWTADDDLGRVEVDLHELMSNSETKNKMQDREDRFKGADVEEEMPGTLTWSVGYFEKTHITDIQLKKQTYNKDVRSKEELKDYVSNMSERKLREAKIDAGHDDELHQQKIQDYREQEVNMLISAPPDPDHKAGILSIQIHNITGLEISSGHKQDKGMQDPEEEGDGETHLPDSYATIILNHRKIYKTRTKPKNAKPFFNAGTERFIKDWTTSEVVVSVRDSREKEDDALLGVVYLPLKELFKKRSQIVDNWPLVGGIGYGRARISLVWRSVALQLPPNLSGWDYGTLEIRGPIRPHGQLDEGLKSDRIKLRTNLGKVTLKPQDGEWHSKRHSKGDDSTFLPVRARYSSALIIEWRKSVLGPDKSPGFSVLWLSELTDEEETTKTLKVWKGGKKNLARAEACCDYQGMQQDDQDLGEIELTMKFWRGLSGFHKAHADKSKNQDVRNVMECLDTINDEDMGDQYSDDTDTSDSDDDGTETESGSTHKETSDDAKSADERATKKKLRTHTDQSKDSSDSSDLESSEDNGFSKVKAPISAVQGTLSKVTDKVTGDADLHNDGKRGIRGQVADYKQNHKQLHRKHRGVMQFRGVRTLDWAGGKAKRMKGRVEGLFEHSEKGQGIETEV